MSNPDSSPFEPDPTFTQNPNPETLITYKDWCVDCRMYCIHLTSVLPRLNYSITCIQCRRLTTFER